MGNAKQILFENISHRGNIQSKSMYWSAEVMLKINSYWRIMRQTSLQAFSKDLKITFLTNQQTTNSNYEVNISNEEKAIYILQKIKLDQQ